MRELPSAEAVPAVSPPSLPIRWIPTLELEGAWQMAIDEALLEASLAQPPGAPALRLYRWSRPTLSLGLHQRRLPDHWLRLAGSGEIDLVRRPSGGRAVLHGEDLSYALIWPAAARQRRRAYGLACGWLCRAFAELGLPLRFGQTAPSRDRASCFATSTAADLVHLSGAKRIGSAQLWRRGTVLQHGSIQLQPQPALWRHLFGEDPPALPPLPLRRCELEDHLLRCARRWLPPSLTASLPWAPGPLDPAELERISAALGRHRVELAELEASGPSTGGSSSPAACIDRVT